MERYFKRGKVGSALDDLGLRSIIALAALIWFFWLWGIGLPSLLAGAALGILGQMTLSRYRAYSVERKEKRLRARLGGELFLEELILCPPRQAHLRAAFLLGVKYPMILEQVMEEGVLCRWEGKLVLISCLGRPAESEAKPDDVLPMQRAGRKYLAEKCVLCLCCRESKALAAWREQSAMPVSVVSREKLLEIAGQISPATDEQLVELGRRKKHPVSGKRWIQSMLHRDRMGRYMFYGGAMLLIYILTGIRWYPLPGLTLLLLGVASCYNAERDPIL